MIYLGYKSEYLMENVHKMNLALFVLKVIGLYVVMLIGYSILTYIYSSVKYARAQEGIQGFYKGLTQMNAETVRLQEVRNPHDSINGIKTKNQRILQ